MKTYPNSSKFSKLTFKFWTDQRALPCCRHNYWAVIQSLLPSVSTEARPVLGRLTCQKTPRIFFFNLVNIGKLLQHKKLYNLPPVMNF